MGDQMRNPNAVTRTDITVLVDSRQIMFAGSRKNLGLRLELETEKLSASASPAHVIRLQPLRTCHSLTSAVGAVGCPQVKVTSLVLHARGHARRVPPSHLVLHLRQGVPCLRFSCVHHGSQPFQPTKLRNHV